MAHLETSQATAACPEPRPASLGAYTCRGEGAWAGGVTVEPAAHLRGGPGCSASCAEVMGRILGEKEAA